MIEDYMIWIWLALFVVTFLIEIFSLDLVSIWFALSSLLGLLLSIFDGIPFYIEIIIVLLFAVILLIATRPLVRKLMKNQERKTNADSLIGITVRLIEDVSLDSAVAVKINGITYTAVSANGESDLKKGDLVKIIALKGNKVVVKK